MNDAILHRVDQLFGQGRYKESIEVLKNYLDTHGDNSEVQFYLAQAYHMTDEKEEARLISDKLLNDDPESLDYVALSLNLDIEENKIEKAESKAELLIEMAPMSSQAYLMMSRVKLKKRSYDKASEFAEKALEMDSENLDAMNLKIMVDGLLGKANTNTQVDDALELEPENPNSIANHAYQMLRDGKIDQALERAKYALSLDPNNYMAKHALKEALRSRFWLYRLLFKYGEWMGKLSANMSWGVIIGSYLVYRFLNNFARNNEAYGPFVMPFVYLIMITFLLTWILAPVINFFLLANPYGKLLLDKEEKLTAKLVGSSLIAALVCLIIYQVTQVQMFLMLALVFGAITIPLSTFMKVTNPKRRPRYKYATIAMFVAGILGAIGNIDVLLFVSIGGVFIYSWAINAEMIREHSRVFE